MNNQILSIKIENKDCIELNQLTLSLNAISCQYDSFLRKSDKFDYNKSQRKLYLSKLESGSVYAELLPAVIPLFEDVNSIIAFGTYLKIIYDYFLGKNNELPYKLTKKDCLELSEIVAQTANDNGSAINIDIKGNDNNIVINVLSLDSTQANAAQNRIRNYLDKSPEPPQNYEKVLMYWANADFRKNKINDKIIIEKIDKTPKKVIFDNEQDKLAVTTHNPKFPNKNWQDLAYNVDVMVLYIEDIVKEYKVTKVYAEETFDPEEI